MRFAVLGCPKCRRVQVVETRTPNVGCRSCNHSFAWHERKLFYHGEDAAEARGVASRLALQVGGAGIQAIAESAAAIERERVVSVADVVGRLQPMAEFTLEDVRSVTTSMGFPGPPEKVVSILRMQDRLFEPRPGRFRWVP